MKKCQVLIALLCALGAVAHAAPPAMKWSDSGIAGPRYATLLEEMQQWQARFPNMATVIDYGKSVKGRPLRLVLVMKKGTFSERPTLIMSGSTHGDEYLHIEDRLPERLLTQGKTPGDVREFLDNGGAIVFIPILNPDGFDARSRLNANGVDLNRDWDLKPAGFKGFTQPETRNLQAMLETLRFTHHLKYAISVDYHCCAGALLYPWAYSSTHLPPKDLARHEKVAGIASRILGIETGVTADVLGYNPVGTTKDYYYSHFNALSYTYEGRKGVEDSYFDKHVAWWDAMIQFVEQGTMRPFLSFAGKKHQPLFHFAD